MRTGSPGSVDTRTAKSEVLLKLIRVEPESLTRLVQQTGWGRAATELALDHLVATNRVRHFTKDGVRVYTESN